MSGDASPPDDADTACLTMLAGTTSTWRPAAVARTVADEVLEGDIERIELPFEPATFDILIAAEVLEHLVDPWAVTKRLTRLVKPGGRIYIGTPNVAHVSVIRMLLANRCYDLHCQIAILLIFYNNSSVRI